MQTQVKLTTITADAAVDDTLGTARTLQQKCKDRKWMCGDREVSVRQQADKVLQFLHRLKPVGDVVANIDPVHVGLPWAGIRVLLEVFRCSLIFHQKLEC